MFHLGSLYRRAKSQNLGYRKESLFATGCLLGSPPGTVNTVLAHFYSLPWPGHRGKKVSAETAIDNSPGQEAHNTLKIPRIYLPMSLCNTDSVPCHSGKLCNVLYGILMFYLWFIWLLRSSSRHSDLLSLSSIGDGFHQSDINYLSHWWRITRGIFTIAIGLSRCIFLDESHETPPPSPRAHRISIPSLESDKMQFSISNPYDPLSVKWAFRSMYYDISVKVSPGIQREHLSSQEVKSSRNRTLWEAGPFLSFSSWFSLYSQYGATVMIPPFFSYNFSNIAWSSLIKAISISMKRSSVRMNSTS